MDKRKISAIAIINILTFLISFSYEMTFTVMPFFLVNALGVSMVVIGIIEGGYDLVSNLVKVLAGYWSDLFSRKKFLIAGIFMSIAARFYFIFGKKWDDILMGTILDAVSDGTVVPVSDTILSSEKKKSLGKTFGINRAIESIGGFLGILTAFVYTAYFLDIPYQKYFYLSIIPLLIAAIIVLFLPEYKPSGKKYRIPIISWEMFFPKYLYLFFILSFANFGYSFYILKVYNQTSSEYKTVGIYVIFTLIIAIASYLSGRFYDRLGEKRFLYLTIFLFFISHLLMIGLPVVGFIIFAFADAFLEIGIWATVGKKVKFRKGFVFGTYHFIVGLSSLFAGVVAGYLWDTIDPEAPFIMGSIASIVAFILIRRFF
ncbi:MFS transporter [Persephonella sp. IF05-L8]|uniref:MFS transporter n=1 Tax=Persephonella sp. IF05-L8 TaxID=1158338 RepID=UPI000496C4D7